MFLKKLVDKTSLEVIASPDSASWDLASLDVISGPESTSQPLASLEAINLPVCFLARNIREFNSLDGVQILDLRFWTWDWESVTSLRLLMPFFIEICILSH